MLCAVYIKIGDSDYNRLNIKSELIKKTQHILTDTIGKAVFIENPIIYKDEDSTEEIIYNSDNNMFITSS